MTIDHARRAAALLWDFAQHHGQPVLVGAGAVGALLALVLIGRFLRTGHVHEKLGRVAVGLATLFAMEGMFEVAHGPLGLNIAGSLMFCATFEVVMLHQGSLAAHKLAAAAGKPVDVSRHMRFVWLVAGASGVIASTASSSVTEVVLRLATPPLAAGIWYMSLYADKPRPERQESNWIWTPQRIGVRLGLLKPGAADDLGEVFRQRQITRMVNEAVVVWAEKEAAKAAGSNGKPSRKLAKASRRLQTLAKTADRKTVAEVREQLRLAINIQAELFRPADPVDDRTRDLLDEIRLGTREVTRSLRTQHRLAFGHGTGPDQIPDQIPQEWLDRFRSTRSTPVVQVPAGEPDQSRTTLVDQPAGPDQTAEVDQPTGPTVDQPVDHSDQSGPDQPADQVDQPATSADTASARAASARRTTARVDRVRPVSPAAGGEIPPRIAAMARDLRKAYRGDIPGRRTVMERMGWTSSGDAQAAINLVRAERANRTTQTKTTDHTAV